MNIPSRLVCDAIVSAQAYDTSPWIPVSPLPIPQLGAHGLTWTGNGVRAGLAAVAKDGVELFGGPLASRGRNCANKGCAFRLRQREDPGKDFLG